MKPCKERDEMDQLIRALRAERNRINKERVRVMLEQHEAFFKLLGTPSCFPLGSEEVNELLAKDRAKEALRRARGVR